MMGQTNKSLVKLFEADKQLREAQDRLDAASKGVRIQERRTNDLAERIRLAQTHLKEAQAAAANADLDIKARDAHIERLRSQQQNAKNNREYQAFLIEINTSKVDRGKKEEEALKLIEQAEKLQNELKDLSAQHAGEKAKLEQVKAQIDDTLKQLQQEIDDLRPARDAAAAALPTNARMSFERLAERYEGEALAAIARPDRRREEYVCTACNMDLVTDVYNKLRNRDELVYCPNCFRILYIPEQLSPDLAVNKPKARKEPRLPKDVGAAVNRQSSAADVLNSIELVEEESDAPPDIPAPEQPSAEQPSDPPTEAT